MSNPTLSDVMNAITTLNGDVKVALDRTVNQGAALVALQGTVTEHGKDLAGTKAQATFFGTLASAIVVGLIEGTKSLLGGGHPGGTT